MTSARFKPYPETKESGIEWLGRIPAYWGATKLKRVCALAYGDSLASDSRMDGDVEVFGSNGPVGHHDQANTFSPCLVIGRKGSFGKVNYSEKRVYAIDTTYYIDSRLTTANLRWLFYVLQWVRLDSTSRDSAIPGLDREDAYIRDVVLCSSAEQQAISDFLDRETAKIDALVEKKQRLIELLQEKRTALITHAVTQGLPAAEAAQAGLNPDVPMKDSGIEWLGQIPKHWVELELKFALAEAITDGPHETPEFVDEGIPFLSAESVKNDRLDFEKKRGFISQEDHLRFSRKYSPKRGDVYMVKSGATTGNVARVETDEVFDIWSPLAAMRPHPSRLITDFLFYFLKSQVCRKSVELSWSFGTQQNIGMGVLSNLRMVLAPLEEQQVIAGFLDQETAKIDALIAKVQEAIERLKEYRTALISAAVTGKIDVRGPVPKEEG